MKEKWTTPKTVIEEFTPNKYIAACWGVCCDVEKANYYEKTTKVNWWSDETWWDRGCSHDKKHCGTFGNQVIYDDNNDGIAERMVEIKTDGLGDLTCTTDKPIGSIKAGQYINWTTSAGDKTWHHQGLVTETVPGHPNMS